MNADSLARLNALPHDDAVAFFLKACGSRRWARAMAAGRPFSDLPLLGAAAERAADELTRDDWLEAFAHHPRIGDTSPAGAKFAPTSAMSTREQSGMAGASNETRHAFVTGNREYEARFSHVFLICATGKSADEMLAQLQLRLNNDPQTELRNAIEQQRQITRLRLAKLLYPEGS